MDVKVAGERGEELAREVLFPAALVGGQQALNAREGVERCRWVMRPLLD